MSPEIILREKEKFLKLFFQPNSFSQVLLVQNTSRKRKLTMIMLQGLFQRYKDNQGIEDLIRVDYGKSMCEVFTDLALYLFRSQQSFDFLSHIEDRAIEDRNRNLPSVSRNALERSFLIGLIHELRDCFMRRYRSY